MTNEVADISISSSLMEDYAMVSDITLAPEKQRFAAFEDSTDGAKIHHIVSVNDLNSVVHLRQGQTAGEGWALSELKIDCPDGSGKPIETFKSFFQDGVIAVFFTFTDTTSWLLMEYTSTHGWNKASLQSNVNSIGAVEFVSVFSAGRQPYERMGRKYFYGRASKTTNFLAAGEVSGADTTPQLFILDRSSSDAMWRCIYLDAVCDAYREGYRYFLTACEGANTAAVVGISEDGRFGWLTKIIQGPGTAQASVTGGKSMTWSENFDNSIDMRDPKGSTRFIQTALVQSDAGTDVSLVLSERGLYACTGYDDDVIRRPFFSPIGLATGPSAGQKLSSLSAIASGVNQNRRAVLFGLDQETSDVWFATPSSDQVNLYAPWNALGRTAAAIACPAYMSDQAELFMIDLKGRPFHLTQATDGTWLSTRIKVQAAKSSKPKRVVNYRMHVTALDAKGTMVPGKTLKIAASRATVIVANGIGHFVTPLLPVTIPTDATGVMSVAIPASSLVAPRLTFSADTAARWCQGDVVEIKKGEPINRYKSTLANKLAGRDVNFPLDGLIKMPGWQSGQTLEAVKAIASTWLLDQQTGDGSLASTNVGIRNWTLNVSHPGASSFRQLTPDELPQLLTDNMRKRGLGDWFEASIDYLKQAYAEIKTITVAAASELDKGFHLIINHGLPNEVSAVASTTQQAGEVVGLLLTKAKDGAEDAAGDALNWALDEFGWDDILLTSQVIKASLNHFFDEVEAAASSLESYVDGAITSVQKQIDDMIKNAETHFGRNTINSFCDSQAAKMNPAPVKNVLAGRSVKDAQQANLSRTRYVSDAAGANLDALPAVKASNKSGLTVTQPFAGYADDPRVIKAQTFLGSLSDPNRLFDMIIVELLDAFKGLVDIAASGAKTAINAVIDAFIAAIADIKKFLNATFEIPIISNLLRSLEVEPTVLDVICVACAAPATILYKALFGQAPVTKAQIAALTRLPSYRGASPTTMMKRSRPESELKLTPVSEASVVPIHQIVCPAFAGLIGALTGVASGYADFMAGSKPGKFEGPGVQAYSWFVGVLSLIPQALSAPYAVFEKKHSSWTSADHLTATLFCWTSIPCLYDLVLTYFDKGLARFEGIPGTVLDLVFGATSELLGITTAVYQIPLPETDYTGWDVANCFCVGGRAIKGFYLNPDVDTRASVCIPIVLTCDGLFTIGASVTLIGGAITRPGLRQGRSYTVDELLALGYSVEKTQLNSAGVYIAI